MTTTATLPASADRSGAPSRWLQNYYATRALVSIVWVALASTIGRSEPVAGAILFVAYPVWDGLANLIDARRNGGLRTNPTQALNAGISAVVALAVAIAVTRDVHDAIGAIGVWAALTGLLQLATGIRRWRRASAQWPQILSGAQSTLAAVHFIAKATSPLAVVSVADVAPYAAFGAFYFAVSAAVLFRR